METHMDEPCDICGDVGVVDAIVTCYLCKITRQHPYCMKTYCRDIPPYWRCEECELSSEMHSPQSGLKEDLLKAPMANSSAIVHPNMDNSGGVNKLSANSGRSHFREKWVDKGKTKYITCQEAIKLSSGSRKPEYHSINTLRSGRGPSNTIPTRCERTPTKPLKVISPNITSQMIKENPTFGILGQSKPRRPDDAQINSVVRQSVVQSLTELKVSENKAVRPPKNEGVHIRQPLDAAECPKEGQSAITKIEMEPRKTSLLSTHCPPCPPPCISGGYACKNVEPGSSNADKRNQKVNVSEVEKYSQSIPSLHAYWKGSFKLPNSPVHLELNDGFKAHPPSRVHLKVYEVLKKMPRVLEFELVPRFKVFTDIFADYCPDKDDIGLYFFPANSESSEKYTSLLEFIWMEKLVLRSYVHGVELLVLTSRVLHVDSQKWKGNYYLWGVFRRVKMDNDKELRLVVHPSHDEHDSHAEGGEVEDMDIDAMEGCGLDYIAAQPLLKWKPYNDIPPGFEGTSRPWVKDGSCSL